MLKEEKGIESVIEIKEEYYIKELEKFDNIYQIAKDEYTKYIEVSFPKEEDTNPFEKNDWNNAFMGFSMFPMFGPIVGIIDILTDKYNKRNHAGSCIGLVLATGVMLLMVLVAGVVAEM